MGTMDLARCRALFDELRRSYILMDDDLRPDSVHVMNPALESAIVKIINGTLGTITAIEAREARIFRKQIAAEDSSATGIRPSIVPATFSERILQIASTKPRAEEAGPISEYMHLNWIPCTSDSVERLFSAAKNILTDHRATMHPKTLEAILMLKENRKLWTAVTMHKAMERSSSASSSSSSSSASSLLDT
jgi:hypothetical protein